MIIARVVGNLVSTVKHPLHTGMKLMMVEAIDFEGRAIGPQQIAVDCACAGIGDTVLVNTDGGAANTIYGDPANTTPIDWVICGVVDNVFVEQAVGEKREKEEEKPCSLTSKKSRPKSRKN